MGWIIMGVILFILLNKPSRCRSRRHTRRGRHDRHDAADYYRMQADLEDMSRRVQAMERSGHRGDDRLRRQFRDL